MFPNTYFIEPFDNNNQNKTGINNNNNNNNVLTAQICAKNILLKHLKYI